MRGASFRSSVTILHGPSDPVVLVPLAAAFAAWATRRYGAAGAFSALALANPRLLLLVPVLFVARRSWRALAAFAGTLAGLGVISVIGFGVGPVITYLRSVGTWAITGRLPNTDQLVYTDPAVYSLRNILEAVPGGCKVAA